MGIRIFLANSASDDGSSIQCEVEPEEKVEGLIETAVEYWELERSGKYGVKCGVSLVTSDQTISTLNIKEGDRLVIVDPERWQANLDSVKNWVMANLGGSSEELELLETEEEGSKLTRFIIQNSKLEGRKYEIVFDDNKVKSYRPM